MIFAEVGAFCFYAPHASTTISWLNAYGYALQAPAGGLNVTVGGTLTQSSDRRLKDDIQDADLGDCQKVFDAVMPRTYRRNDYKTTKTRIGLVAQEVKDALPDNFQNIVAGFTHGTGEAKTEMLGIDYGRLSTILWGVAKNQQTMLRELTLRIEALEAPKKKATKSK
jgi:hypothetical protein